MEVSSPAITGVMKAGIQIVSSHKTPVLEIYHQMRNRFGPAFEHETPLVNPETGKIKQKTRFQDIFIEFTLLNIGGSRAENIKLSLSGDLRRNPPRESFGDLFDVVIPQMAPGQSRFLFMFDVYDLNKYPEGGGHPIGLKDESFTIAIEYDAGKGLLNWLFSLPSKVRGKRRFRAEYTFFPQLVTGDLPPGEYTS
ncbi:hypothetical protein [Marinobacter sp. UBA2678]|jgi:hypothetical protein|uniref:hypothetical protein n=1 Tax=Marinobacter sp. UBA2678 TaxID=1946815 RepID=UPI002579DFD4|nr:hypothetical protein [Marinobacter sp. UBA2678]|tara:strand:- start:158 stop:742 length:585 start_codon:yes stop_codon:yes gene_type:complete